MTESSSSTQGHLIAWIVLFLYVLFTILPNSYNLAVQWPLVLLWQSCYLGGIIWFLGRLWLLRRLTPLGKVWDIMALTILVGVTLSTLFARFSNQAIWSAIPILGWLATLYVLSQSLTTSQGRYRLLTLQGGLSIAFILVGLITWLRETLLPELTRLAEIKDKLGLDLSFDFSVLELRNWAPLGHQNYVGGYLVLAIPLLVGLSILQKGWPRLVWITGIFLSLLHLYTTSSKGAWLALLILSIVTVVLLFRGSFLPRRALILGSLALFTALAIFIFSNNRLRDILVEIFSGRGGSQELTYRLITGEIGYQMGLSSPLTGAGIGGVPLLFQKYHPVWAGAQSEHIYQLHSTLTQLWAELGIWGLLLFLASLALLAYGFSQRTTQGTDGILSLCLYGGLFAYLIVSFTDYQLDNLPINGLLLIYLACLTSSTRDNEQISDQKFYPLAVFYSLLFILAAMLIWSFPVHQAWLLSSQGFKAGERQDLKTFTQNLQKAYQLTPWEPYYAYQLGWNLGNLALQVPDNRIRKPLLIEAIRWFQAGIQASPYLEFGHSNLGWLLLQAEPKYATGSFIKAIELFPAKKGNAYGLGLSLLFRKKPELAIKALTLECLRRPVFITSPIWNTLDLKILYPQVIAELLQQYGQLLQKYPQPGALNTYLHQVRGAVHWWTGDFSAAAKDFQISGDRLSQLLLKASKGQSIQSEINSINLPIAQLTLQAWYNSNERINLLEKAWVKIGEGFLSEDLKKQFVSSFQNVSTLDQWLKEKSPILQYRNERPNFGVNSRHIDGPLPVDFYIVIENAVMTRLLDTVLPSPIFFPELDLAIQPIREQWLKELNN